MIEDLDEVLRQLLIRDLPVKNGEVDIKFDQPKREWSARLSRPTLNLFLYDLRENAKLRQTQPAWEIKYNDDGTVTQRRKPVRLDLHYLITAWATDPEDEHRLLTRTLMTLFRHPHLPDDLLTESLQDQPVPISTMVAQDDEMRNPADFWSALDNELRPSLVYVVTMAIDPHRPFTAPLVRTRELRVGPSYRVRYGASPLPLLQELDERAGLDGFWAVGGTVHSQEPLENLQITLVEGGLAVTIRPEDRFVVGNLKPGEYTLEVSCEGRKPSQHKITVPSTDYDLEIP